MKYLSSEEIGGGVLFNIRLTDCEIETIENCFDYVVQKLETDTIEKISGGCTKEEICGMRDSIRFIILEHYNDKDLPLKANQWD